MPKEWPRADHIVITAGVDHEAIGRCNHCGTRLRWPLPMAIEVWVEMTQAFIQLHRSCQV
jgi:hypothetical protein